jgi:hypothetical protein
VVQTKCVTDQQVMRVDPSDLHDLVLAYPELHGSDLRK